MRDCMLDLGLSRLLVCRKALEIHLFCYEVLVSGMDAAHFVYVSDLLIRIFSMGVPTVTAASSTIELLKRLPAAPLRGFSLPF